MFYVYMLRCENGSIYTGVAKNVEKRYKEHIEGHGAKYTRIFKPIKIEKIFECENRSKAQVLEYKIKKLSKLKKEKIIENIIKI